MNRQNLKLRIHHYISIPQNKINTNQITYVQDLKWENHKTLTKLKEQNGCCMLIDRKTQHASSAFDSQVQSKLIFALYSVYRDKLILKFTWRRNTQNREHSTKEKNSGGWIPPGLKTTHQALAITQSGSQQKRQTEQGNIIKNTEIRLKYCQLIFDK